MKGFAFTSFPTNHLRISSSNSDHASWGNWNIKLVPSIFVLIILGQAHRAGTTTGPSFFLIKKRPDSIKNRDAAQKARQNYQRRGQNYWNVRQSYELRGHNSGSLARVINFTNITRKHQRRQIGGTNPLPRRIGESNGMQ